MKTFKDRGGRSWDIEVHGETVARVKSLCDLLLTDLIGGEAGMTLAADPIRVMDVLAAVCKPQIDERKVEPADFRKGLDGDALESAVDSLIAEVTDFFPKPRREIARKIVLKGQQAMELATRRVMEEVDKMTPESLLAKSRGATSGSLLESSGSTPPASLSEVSA
jgi:hypothetical protein